MSLHEIVYYETTTGHCPVQEFIMDLPKNIAAKALRDIDLLEKHGHELRDPYSKHLRDGVFELRTQFAGDCIRIFYFFFDGNRVILTNGYVKKTQKMPAKEFEMALKYKTEYKRR